MRSEEHTSELQSLTNLVCRLLLEKKKRWRSVRPSRSCAVTRTRDPLRTTDPSTSASTPSSPAICFREAWLDFMCITDWRQLTSTLFPYTTLFRSHRDAAAGTRVMRGFGHR